MTISERKLKRAFMPLRSSVTLEARSAWVQSTRERILSVQRADTARVSVEPVSLYKRARALGKVFIPLRLWRYALQPALVMVLVLGVGTGGWITSAHASSRSLPGDALYPMKIVSEKTQLAIAGFSNDERVVTDLHVAFAKRRLEELQTVTTQGDVKDREKRASTAMKGFTKEVSNLKNSLNTVARTEPLQAVAVARRVEESSKEFAHELSLVAQPDGLSEKAVQEARSLVAQTGEQAVAMMARAHEAGGRVTSEEIERLVAARLARVRADVLGVGDAVDKEAQRAVNGVVDEAERLIERGAYGEALARLHVAQKITEVVPAAPESGAQEQSAGAAEKTIKPLSFSEVLVRVIESTTSTIIGER